jgi:CRISPR system Cascade subunit CasB
MDNKYQTIVKRWWQSMMLSPERLKELHIQPAPSAYRAQLKRCESADAAMLTEAFRTLWMKISEEETDAKQYQDIECWATIAVALSHIRGESDNSLATVAGRKGDGDKSTVSELRFSQLQSAKTPDELLRRLRRILMQVKGDVSVNLLAKDVYQWFLEQKQQRPRQATSRIAVKWAMDYYRAAPH